MALWFPVRPGFNGVTSISQSELYHLSDAGLGKSTVWRRRQDIIVSNLQSVIACVL